MMKPTRLPRILALTAAAVALAFLPAGCGGKKPVNVTGKLVLPSKFKLKDTDTIQLIFVPDDKTDTTAVATVEKTGEFKSSTVVPGKYKVTVKVDPYAGEPGNDKRQKEFEGFNKAHDLANSKLTYDFTSDSNQSITIDTEKDTITKG